MAEAWNIPGLTARGERLAAAIASGASIADAARSAGVTAAVAHRWLARAPLKRAVEELRADARSQAASRVAFGIEEAHSMYMHAYALAGNSSEMIKATDSLVKMHGVGAAHSPKPVDGGGRTIDSDDYETLSDEELAGLAARGSRPVPPGLPAPAADVLVEEDF